MSAEPLERRLAEASVELSRLKSRVGSTIVGMGESVEGSILCLLSGGHCLVEGVPGLGKTLLVKTLAESMELKFSRVQFTPDLMPADITGTLMVTAAEGGRKGFEFQRGPVFANIVLADEVNRATPKTQSALLEAMQEAGVTVAGQRLELPQPFFVMATQNPIEMEGTYPLPEAQLDRFLLKLKTEFPTGPELKTILDRTTGAAAAPLAPALAGARVLALRALVRDIPAADHVKEYAIRLVLASHPDRGEPSGMAKRFVRYGASPRGVQALILSAKARALVHGRPNASLEDVQALAKAALRHRIVLNFEGEAEGVSTDQIVEDLLKHVSPLAKTA